MLAFQQFLAEHAGETTWTVKQCKDSFLTARPAKEYTCPVCKHKHSSRGMFAYRKGKSVIVNCFSNKETKLVEDLPAIAVQLEDKSN